MNKHLHKVAAVTLSAAMTFGYLPHTAAVHADSAPPIYETDFEDGDVSMFQNRGDNDTTEISASTENALSGKTALLASNRSDSWHGACICLSDICEPNTEYYVSGAVTGRYYTNATVSFQYSDEEGAQHYSNLQSLNGNGWQTFENLKVSFTATMTDVYVYIEGGTDDYFLDDFSIVEVPTQPIETEIASLKNVYADYFKIGTAITPAALSSKSTMALVEKHFSGSITVGNEMKPDSVLNQAACKAYYEETGDDTDPQISFSAAKPVLNYCQEHNIPVRIHTLVWHSQTPDWFFKEGYADDGAWVSADKMLKRMEHYIKNYFTTLTELYPDVNFYACDVVNEAWTDNGTPRNPGEQGSSGSANSAWVQVFGDNSFIEPAFTYARAYAPAGCKLYYNDYNEYMPAKTSAIVEMATSLKAKGVIDGIGMQSHLDARTGSDAFPSISAYEKAVKAFSETGLDIQVTELDVTIPGGEEANYKTQAQYYSDIMDVLTQYSEHISAVVFWGITDDGSWRASQYPLLFDASYTAKPAYYAIIDGITPASTTTTTTATTPDDIKGLRGDVDCDGEVALADAILLARYVAEDTTVNVTAQGLTNADMNSDGVWDASDLTTILRILAKLEK